MVGERLSIVFDPRPALGDKDTAIADPRSGHVERDPGRSGRGHQPAPIRVAAVPAAFDEVVLDDPLGRGLRFGVAGRAGDSDVGHPRHPFRVASHLHREVAAGGEHGARKFAFIRFAAAARSKQHRGIVGRGRAVDVERIERRVRGGLERPLHHRQRNLRIRSQEGEHRRHVGRDHAAAFGHPAEREVRALDDDLLGLVIGRQDSARGIAAPLGRQFLRKLRGSVQDRVDRQLRADDSGRADQDMRIGDLKGFAGRRGHQLRILISGRARPRIGIARIDDHRRRLPAVGGERRAVELDRRRDELVLGKNRGARHRAAVIGREQRHVELALLDSGMAAGGEEALGRGHTHGYTPIVVSPAVSSRPSMRLAHWTICPAAPLPRLSIAAIARTRPVRSS